MKIIAASLLFLSLTANSQSIQVFRDSVACFNTAFKTAQTPTSIEMIFDQNWLCSGVYIMRDPNGEEVYETDIAILTYNFSMTEKGIINRYSPKHPYSTPYSHEGELIPGLMSYRDNIADSYLADLIRVDPAGYLLVEWSLGREALAHKDYLFIHPRAPQSELDFWDSRLVTRYHVCVPAESYTPRMELPCLHGIHNF